MLPVSVRYILLSVPSWLSMKPAICPAGSEARRMFFKLKMILRISGMVYNVHTRQDQHHVNPYLDSDPTPSSKATLRMNSHLLGKVDTRAIMEARALVLVERAWACGVDLVRVREVGRVGLCISEAAEDDVARLHGDRRFTVSERDTVCDSGDTEQACELWVQTYQRS